MNSRRPRTAPHRERLVSEALVAAYIHELSRPERSRGHGSPRRRRPVPRLRTAGASSRMIDPLDLGSTRFDEGY